MTGLSLHDGGVPHDALMDSVYRRQRHFYDVTRRYYLLGRDRLIEDLAPPRGGSVLEVGCGTGRNLILAREAHPQAHYYGFDISSEMLEQARLSARRAGLGGDLTFAQGDAADFDPAAAFGVPQFDRVFMSYTISMIPVWEDAIAHAATLVAPGGRLHIVDFGQQERLPRVFRAGLHRWLAAFHVSPRAELEIYLDDIAAWHSATLRFERLHRGYAWYAVLDFARN